MAVVLLSNSVLNKRIDAPHLYAALLRDASLLRDPN